LIKVGLINKYFFELCRAYYQSSLKWLLRFKFVTDFKFVLVELETATQEIVLL
jgi:hypothetical protein